MALGFTRRGPRRTAFQGASTWCPRAGPARRTFWTCCCTLTTTSRGGARDRPPEGSFTNRRPLRADEFEWALAAATQGGRRGEAAADAGLHEPNCRGRWSRASPAGAGPLRQRARREKTGRLCVISALLVLALSSAPCDLRRLERAEAQLTQVILATPDDDPKLPELFRRWDRLIAEVDACRAAHAAELHVPGG